MNAAPRQRKPLPSPEPEPEQPPAPAEPEPAPEPVARQPQPVAAPQPVPVATRYTCSYCETSMPLTELHQVADSMQCADVAGCMERAAARDLYPQRAERADEHLIAARELRQGVPA